MARRTTRARAWLASGKPVGVEKVCTWFGTISYTMAYDAAAGVVRAGAVKDRLRPGVADLTPPRLRDPHVGDELRVILGEVLDDEDRERARAWLYQIANRTALDELRRRRIVRFLPFTGEPGETARQTAPCRQILKDVFGFDRFRPGQD